MPCEIVAGRVAVDLHEQADVIEHRWYGGGQRDFGVAHVHELRHDERGCAQHRRRQHGAGRGARFDGAGVGRAEARLLHHRDGHGAGGQHVRHDAAADRAQQAAGKNAHLGGTAAERAAQRERQVDEELAGSRHHQRRAEHEEADDGLGERLNGDAEQALGGEHMIGDRLIEGRLIAPQRSEPARFRKQRIDGEGQDAQQQAPAARAAQRLHEHHPHDEAGAVDEHRRAAELPAELRRLADVEHEIDRGSGRRDEQHHVVPGNPVAARAPASGEDQERERQHAQDEKVVILRVELREPEEEAQVELLVDAQPNGDCGHGDEQPPPQPPEPADVRDFGLDQASLDVRIRRILLFRLRSRLYRVLTARGLLKDSPQGVARRAAHGGQGGRWARAAQRRAFATPNSAARRALLEDGVHAGRCQRAPCAPPSRPW